MSLDTEEKRQDVRRRDDSVTKAELGEFVSRIETRLDTQDIQLGKFDSALFAATSDNEHGQRGLMHTARNIDNHIASVCWSIKAIATLCGALVAVSAAARAFGFI